jgi:LysM domain
MSLTIAPPSVTRRALTSTRRVARPARPGVSRPQLRVVRDDEPALSVPAGVPERRVARTVAPVGPQVRRRAAAGPDSGSVPPIRLTRRGRVVVRAGVVLLVVLALAGGVLLMGRSAEAGSTPTRVAASYRVVLPGETLWKIAGEVAPGADRRDTVADIIDLNALSSAEVFAGQRIAVPARPAKG